MQTIHGQVQISLFHVARSSYSELQLVENTHPTWALSYVARGYVQTLCRGELFEVHAGDLMIHPPGVAYSELASGPGTHEWLLLSATLPANVDLFRLYPVAPVVHITAQREFSLCFAALYELWERREGTFRQLQMLAYTTQLLSLVLHSWEQAGSVPRPLTMQTAEDRFSKVISYMLDHLDEKLSRDHLASIVGLHPVYFDRLFRQTYGLAPLQLLRNVRLERAKTLLESGEQSIAQIAATCGYASAAAFIHRFQEKYRQTPGEYRQSLKRAIERYKPFL